MTITRQIQINCASDSCSVTVSKTGTILIGSVRIQPSEVTEFLNTLAKAVEQVQSDNPTEEPIKP